MVARISRHTGMMILAAAVLYPIVWLASASLKTSQDIFTTVSLLPDPIHWINYIRGWTAVSGYTFAHFLFNSLFVSASIVVGTILSTSLVAYGFARMHFPLKSLWFSIMMLTIMIPKEMLAIPQYVLFSKVGWINTYLPLIVPAWFASVNGTFFVFMVVQFLRGIPKELDEAAMMDGCGSFRFFWRILFPVLRPVLVTVGVFSFLWSYEDFFTPLLYLNSVRLYTLPVYLSLFQDNTSATNWGPMFSVSFLSIVPLFVIFFVAQRYIVDGIAAAGQQR